MIPRLAATSSFRVTSTPPRIQIQMFLLPSMPPSLRRSTSRKPQAESRKPDAESMTHAQLVEKAVRWLRNYRCGVVLSEQACVSGEMPDAIGWKRACHSVLIECKITRADFFVDRDKPFRRKQECGLGWERFYLAPAGMIRREELPVGWGLLE